MPLARFSHATQSENLPKNMGHLAPAAISAPVGLFRSSISTFSTPPVIFMLFFFSVVFPRHRLNEGWAALDDAQFLAFCVVLIVSTTAMLRGTLIRGKSPH